MLRIGRDRFAALNSIYHLVNSYLVTSPIQYKILHRVLPYAKQQQFIPDEEGTNHGLGLRFPVD